MDNVLVVKLDDPRLSDWERHVVSEIAAKMRDAAVAAAEEAVVPRPAPSNPPLKVRPNAWLGNRPRMTPSWMTR